MLGWQNVTIGLLLPAALSVVLGLGGAAQAAAALELSLERRAASGFRMLPELSLARDLPALDAEDENAFFVLVKSPSGYLPTSAGVWTEDGAGEPLDQLGPIPLELAICPDQKPPAACARAGPVRLVQGPVDRGHPALVDSAVVARVGGRVVVEAGGRSLTAAVVGPEQLSGKVHQFRLRAHVLRAHAGGLAATGTDDEQAIRLARQTLTDAAAVFGQCGFSLGPERPGDVRIVDPPTAALVEIGCHGGLPAAGGTLELALGGVPLQLSTRQGESPGSVAGRLARELRRRGAPVSVAKNPPTESGAGPSYDVLVPASRAGRGLGPPSERRLSTDPTLGVCFAELDLGDGLAHFEDETARAASLEERLLLRGVVDADPRTIDIVVVPYFSGRGRIGESFIGGQGASLENLIILDRAGLRATVRSSTLAHELGHVLFAQPGHPDDFGRDTPQRLMDSDASDATAFGPRRLLLEECQRALAEHGPAAPIELLEEVPLRGPGD